MLGPFRDWGRPPLILVVVGCTLLAMFVHPGFVFGLVLAAALAHGYRMRTTRDAELSPVAALLGLSYKRVSWSHLRSLPSFATLRGAWNQGNVTELMSGARGPRPPCPPAELGALLDDTLALARALRRALRCNYFAVSSLLQRPVSQSSHCSVIILRN